jgi:hypothetical protein
MPTSWSTIFGEKKRARFARSRSTSLTRRFAEMFRSTRIVAIRIDTRLTADRNGAAPRHRRCPTSRDFVPRRFLDAGRHSAWKGSSCRQNPFFLHFHYTATLHFAVQRST